MTIDSRYFPQYNNDSETDEYVSTLESIGSSAMQLWVWDTVDWTELVSGFTWEFGPRDPIFYGATARSNGTLSLDLPEGSQFVFARGTPIANPVVFVEGKPFDGNAFEFAVDTLTMILQELEGHYLDCSDGQDPGNPGPTPDPDPGSCVEWGVGTATDTMSLVWEDVSHQITSGFGSNVRGDAVIAVIDDRLYQMDRINGVEYRQSNLVFSPDLGQNWEAVTAPYDDVREEHSPGAHADWPGNWGYTSMAQRGDTFYVGYTDGTGHRGAVFSTTAGNPTGLWTLESSNDDNSAYAPNRNNVSYGITSYMFNLNTVQAPFFFAGRPSNSSNMSLQLGQGSRSNTQLPGDTLDDHHLILNDTGGSPYSRNPHNLGYAGGTYYISDGAGRLLTHRPADVDAGNRSLNGVSWNGSAWIKQADAGTWRTTVSNTQLNGWVIAGTNYATVGWANGKGYVVIPHSDRFNYGAPGYGNFFVFSGLRESASEPPANDLSSLLVTSVPGEDETSPEFVKMEYLEEADRFVLYYGFTDTTENNALRLHVRVAADPNGPWSGASIIDFAPYAFSGISGNVGQMGYSKTQGKFVFSSVMYEPGVSNNAYQRTFTFLDPFVCIDFGSP